MIDLRNVSKHYGSLKAVDQLNLHVKEGETCVLLGKSGCGKSTTLRMINKLIAPTSGEVFVGGKNINDYVVEDLRRGIGYAIQNVGLFPYMNVEKNISVVPQLLKWDKKKTRERVEELLDLVGLDVGSYIHKYPSELSGGEAQRIGVARALAADPPIVLMDEPFGAVDPINRDRLQQEFLKIQKKLHKTVVFVTHDIEEAIRMGDRIAIMDKGVLQNYDTPERIMLCPNSEFIESFLGKDYYLKLLSRFNVSDYLTDIKNCDSMPELRIPYDETLQDALSMMISKGEETALVIGENDAPAGVVKLNDIIDVMKMTR